MGEQRCETCRFRHPLMNIGPNGLLAAFPDGMSEQEWEVKYGEGSGECRRNPPSAGKNRNDVGRFPEVTLFMWCGEYQPTAAPVPEPAKVVEFGAFLNSLHPGAVWQRLREGGEPRDPINTWEKLFSYPNPAAISCGFRGVYGRKLVAAIVAAGVPLPESWREKL